MSILGIALLGFLIFDEAVFYGENPNEVKGRFIFSLVPYEQ
jgi:hypothetical protein